MRLYAAVTTPYFILDIASFARDLVERFGWWGVFVAMALQGATMPIASELTMTLAGWFLIQNVGLSPWISDAWFARWGVWAAFICRLLPFGRTIITLPAGAARVPVVPFAVATFGGGFLWAAFLAALGYHAGNQWERVQAQLGQWTLPIAIVTVVVLIVVYTIIHVRRARR